MRYREQSAIRRHLSAASAPLAAALLAGCAVGPDFQKPAAPPVTSYTRETPSTTAQVSGVPGGDAQSFAEGRDIPDEWWTLFHSKPLDDLIAQALRNNADLAAAEAALRVAHENRKAAEGSFFPSIGGNFSAERQKQPETLAPVPANNAVLFNLFTPQVSISYSPDIWGLNRRTVEASAAQEDAARSQMLAVRITLASNVAVTAIELASVEDEIAATRALVAGNAKMVEILQYQFDKGYASGIDLAGQKSQAAQIAATLPPLLKQEAQLRDSLAALAGRYPSEAPTEAFALASLTLPHDLPLSLPSKLVEQRPDVLQAESNLHAASAEIGVAIANRLPNITLSASAGSTALSFDKIFSPGTGLWTIGGSLAAPIFDGGTLLHQERGARAAYDEAAAQYRSTVLTSFQNVADTLTALEQDADGLKAAAAAEAAAKTTLDMTERQVRDGYGSTLALLNAEQSWHQARIALVQAEAARFTDTAALFQALGGGWWHDQQLAGGGHEG
jgi:NodT family efflux transporter outer membrane factor (OMF) lipoprotein